MSVPLFELMGTPCGVYGCKGVLVGHIWTSTRECFHQCSICRRQTGRMSLDDKLAWARRTIERAVKGQKSD